MRDAAGNISNVSTDLGAAFDTTGAQRDLTGMDIAGMQDRYQSDYIEGMVDPVMSRMREDEARRLAEIEGSSAAIGGSSNTRMAVEAARLSDESSRSRAQTEAEMRQTSLREGQALGLQEAGLRGDLTNMAAQLGLSQSELEASIREREASLGISREQAIADISQNAGQLQLEGIGAAGDLSQAAAQLGMDRAELEASIRERAAQLGISVEEAQRAVLGDISANIGAQYGMSADLADQNNTAANTSLDIGQLGIGAAGLGMAAGGVQIDEAERERALTQEAQQAPLTMESWYRNLVSGGPAIAPPSTNTATQTGGGPSTAAQILGGITSIGGLLFSDENVKTDVEQLGGALDIIRKQRPSVYSYTDPVYDRVPIEGRRSAGLMAQDLEDIPGAVFETESGIKMVDSYPVMATIAAALQELDAKVEAMSHGG
jgi:DNA-binding phage protein